MKRYPEEFLKREALNLAAQPGMKVARVERDLGITPGLLYKWPSAIVLTRSAMALSESPQHELRMREREILKKAAHVLEGSNGASSSSVKASLA